MTLRRLLQTALLALLVASLCLVGSGPARAQVTKHVKLVSSQPLRGGSTAGTQPVVNGIRMALDEVGSVVGDVAIDYQPLDDGDSAGTWDPAMETANAQNAAADSAVIGYLGPYNSGAARISIPILCKAGVVMVSPSNTYPGLTKPGTGTADEPFTYYPSCRRNYARTIPADDTQGTIGAAWAKSLGATKVYILYDDSGPGFGKVLADAFRTKASVSGLLEAGYEHVAKADTYLDLAHRISSSGADLVYYGGVSSNNPGFVLRDLRRAGSTARFMGPGRPGGGGISDATFLQQAGAPAEGAYATNEFWAWQTFNGKASDFLTRYRVKYGVDPGDYAIYAYDAASAFIAAIRAAGTKADDRATVLGLVMGTTNLNAALGGWSFDGNGDTTFSTTSAWRVVNGTWVLQGSIPTVVGVCVAARLDPATQTVYLPNITKTLGGPTGFQTPFIVQNTGTAAATLEVSFYKFSDGTCVTRRSVSSLTPGSSYADIPNNDADLPANTQFSVVVKSFGANVVSVVNEHAGTGDRAEALSYVGVSAGATSVFLPNIVRHFFGYHTPFIIQNLGTASTTATATFRPFAGSGSVTITRTVAPGQSQFIEPNVELGLADIQYAVNVTATQPIAVVVNTHNDDPSVANPVAYSTNGIATGAASVYGPYAAKNANDQGFTATLSTIVVQNMGSSTATSTLTFTPLGGGTPIIFTGPATAAGASWAFDPRYENGVAGVTLCGVAASAGCLADGEYSFVASSPGGSIAAAVNVISPTTAMGYTALAQPAAKYFLPNVTRTLGGASGWTTPILLQAVTATGASVEWRRFSDGALVTTQNLTLTAGASVRIDPRNVATLSDNTQYAVTVTGIGGTLAAIVTELNFQGGDGAMTYEGFAAP
ncbi:MAG: hypothetical protein E6J13_08420 [Chloroflexi bacterium]|nr:MAG: hypothetical protein E6J13_08420 [Chloroflexota bacterium]